MINASLELEAPDPGGAIAGAAIFFDSPAAAAAAPVDQQSPPQYISFDPPATLAARPLVFIVAPLQQDLTKSLAASGPNESRYCFVAVACADAGRLCAVLALFKPGVLLIDAGHCQRLNERQLQLLRRSSPATVWVLGWSAPGMPAPDLLLWCRAVGAIEWQAGLPLLQRALDAVLAGQMWFPRSTMQALLTLLLQRDVAAEALGTGGLLTAREREVLALVRDGLTNKQIAVRLEISANTVKKHVEHALDKRGLRCRRQLFA